MFAIDNTCKLLYVLKKALDFRLMTVFGADMILIECD